MKVLQFAFDPKGDSEYLPHNYEKNVVVYTGTHDNDTIKGWFQIRLSKEEREFCKAYTGMQDENDNWKFIKTCNIKRSQYSYTTNSRSFKYRSKKQE